MVIIAYDSKLAFSGEKRKKKRKKKVENENSGTLKWHQMSSATFWCLFQSSGSCHLRDLLFVMWQNDWLIDWQTNRVLYPLAHACWRVTKQTNKQTNKQQLNLYLPGENRLCWHVPLECEYKCPPQDPTPSPGSHRHHSQLSHHHTAHCDVTQTATTTIVITLNRTGQCVCVCLSRVRKQVIHTSAGKGFINQNVLPQTIISKIMCVHIHTLHTHTYIHTYIHTHIHTHTYTHRYTYTYTYRHTYMYTYIHTQMNDYALCSSNHNPE